MLPETTASGATFAAVFVALYVAHQVADHWIQTQHQADCKGRPGWPGRIACAAHVTTYTLTVCVVLVALAVPLGMPLDPGKVAAGLAVSAVTHYIADRRTPLRWQTSSVRAGSTPSASPDRAAMTTRRSAPVPTPSISPSTTCSCSSPPS